MEKIENNKKNYVNIFYYLILTLFAMGVGYASLGKGFNFTTYASFGGDGTLGATLIKSIQENGLLGMWFNERIGAPDGSLLIDFPACDIFMHFLIWVISWFTDSTAAIQYIYLILTFGLNAVSMSLLLRKLNINRETSFVISALFAFAPYHFFRYLSHSTLTNHISIPIAIYLSLYVLGMIQEEKKWKIILCAFLLGFGYGYFYAFGLILIAVATVIRFLKSEDKKAAVKSLWVIAIVLLFVLLSLMPRMIYSLIAGSNSEAGKRQWIEQEIYGLKIINLLLPVSYHRIGWMRGLTEEYLSRTLYRSEGEWAYLGTVGSVGFLILCGALIYSFACKKKTSNEEWNLIDFLSLSTLVLVLMGSIGGFGLIFNWAVTSQIRCYNRCSIVIAALALIIIAMLMNKIERKKKWLSIVVSVLVLFFGMFDQVNIYPDNWQATNASIQKANEVFFDKVENALPDSAMVYQLPYMVFPEAGKVNNMHDYEPLVGYLFSEKLRWSYGDVRGRHSMVKDLYVDEGMSQEFLINIKEAGFQAVYIDVDGYEDGGEDIIKYYNSLGLQPIVSEDETLYVYDISSYEPKNIPYERLGHFLIDFAAEFDVEIQVEEAQSLIMGIHDRDPDAINTVYSWVETSRSMQYWTDKEYISALYDLILNRSANEEECNGWIATGYSRQELFNIVITSTEFRNRFALDEEIG